MSNNWPKVKLGEVLKQRQEFVTIEDLNTYRRPRVQLHAKGIVLRDEIPGALIKTKKQQVCRAGEFLVAEIDAKVGGYGIVPESLDRAIVSSHYFLFVVDATKLDRTFLDFFIRTPGFAEQVAAQGSTNYAAIRPSHVLSYEIPLPSLIEQRRIVARIEELAAKIEEVQESRRLAAQESAALLLSEADLVFEQLAEGFEVRKFDSFSPQVTSGPRNWAKLYDNLGYRFYRAQDIGASGKVLDDCKVFITPPAGEQGRSAMLQHGDLMLVITGATVGRSALFRDELEPGFVSQHVAICRLPADEVEPEFVLWGLRSPGGQEQLLGQRYGQGKPGLNLSNIRALSLPFPPLSEQRRIVAYLDQIQAKVEALQARQADTSAQIDALMPSILDKAFRGELFANEEQIAKAVEA